MVDQDASSPLSEPLDSTTPVPIAAAPIESDPPHASSRIADSVRPIASTSTANPQTQLESAKKLKSTRTRRKSTATMKRGTHEPTSGAADATAPDESCPACRPDANGKNKRAEMVWVECDAHWPCVAPNPADSPDSIDKWYCEACLTASISNGTPLAISHKPDSTPPVPAQVASTSSTTSNVRKSGRATKSQIDYSNLHMHLPASVDRWSHVIAARKQSGQIKPDQFARKQPHELTTEWIHGPDGMLEPFVVETPDGLGMRMPKRDITVTEIADLIGPQTPLEVIDCASQSSLSNWTLGQWAQYYSSPDRDKVRNVISLEVSDTKLGKMVVAPELVRNLDWVDTIWPDDMKQPGQFPRVQKYCLMSVEKCWTDWHVDFAGSSVFYHVLKGGKTFYFIRPTPANLAAYERWSGSTERQEQEWLGDSCDEVLKIELKEGNTAFLPTGWIHAVYTPADSIVIGGNFLHSLNIPTQLRIYEIELATKVPKKFRYPHFVKLLWLVAIHYDYHLSRMTLPPTSDHPLPPTLSSRVLEGLFALSSFLINQTTRFIKSPTVSAERRKIARENVPWNKVVDPVKLSREFRKNVLRALGKELDADCFKPHGVEDDDATSSSGGVAANGKKGGVKRKGAEEPIPGPKSAKIRHASTTAGSPPPAGSLQNQGEIIARHAIPVAPSTRFEPRGDPKKPELGLRPAEVKDTRSSQVVVRRWEENGETFVETRTVHTIIERVRWTDIKQEDVSTAGARAPYQPYVVNSPALGPQNGYPPFNANGHHVHRVYPSQAGATASVFTPQYPPSYYPQNYPSQPAPIAANGSGAPSTANAAVPHFPPSVYPAPSPSDRPTMTNHQTVPGQ